jgi:DNA-binding transcriptional regulator PaaX
VVVRTPIGPSLQIIMGLGDALAGVSVSAAREVWTRWFGEERFNRKLAALEAAGLVERVNRAGNLDRVIRLTESGRLAALGGRDPEACWRRPWDGLWRLVLFDIPETKAAHRVKLWRQLRSLGFGY